MVFNTILYSIKKGTFYVLEKLPAKKRTQFLLENCARLRKSIANVLFALKHPCIIGKDDAVTDLYLQKTVS